VSGFEVVQLPLDPGGEPSTLSSGEIAEWIEAESRPANPWVIVNMVSSVDGATAVEGVSGELGADADRAVFLALRGVADVILAGSGTVTAERYRRTRLDDDQRSRRGSRQQAATPRIAVVSNAGDIDLDLPLFAPGPDATRPLVLVASGAVPPERRRALDEVAEVVVCGTDRVDLGAAVDALAERVGPVVLCEGGPVLNGLLAERDRIDEWCVTVAPMVVGGESRRAAVGPNLEAPRSMDLSRAWLHGSELLLRYVRSRGNH
jgi:riboflavin biosynthesis pyrimidine reductase